MTTLEELGLLKMDFLGLRTLTVIDDTVKACKKNGVDIDIETIPLDDEAVFSMLSKGQTEGIFQFESAGIKSVFAKLKPNSLEDLIAVTSLYRPGPMDSIPTYIHNRHHPEDMRYKTPLLEPILNVTNGCIVYQEQVMQICCSLAGYSYGRADIVRRAMSKKKKDVLEKERADFIAGASERNISADIAESIFNEITAFASYAFNKSHAAAYALIAYQTAYLKVHCTNEYMAALLTSVLFSSGKLSEYINECNALGIKVLPPSVNKSTSAFTVDSGAIRFSLLAIKNLGATLIEKIVKERDENGSFKSVYDFCSRCYGRDLNRRSFECLILSGALDNLGVNRRQMMQTIEITLNILEIHRKRSISGQLSFFLSDNSDALNDIIEYPNIEEMPPKELLRLEKEVTGLYLSSHPLEQYRALIAHINAAKISELLTSEDELSVYKDNSRVKIFGIVTTVKAKATKNEQNMAFVTVEDLFGSIEVLVFPKTLIRVAHKLLIDNVVQVSGKLSLREDKEATILVDDVMSLEEIKAVSDNNKKGLYVRIPSKLDDKYNACLEIFGRHKGKTKLFIYFLDSKKLVLAPADMHVNATEDLYAELSDVLGSLNVKNTT